MARKGRESNGGNRLGKFDVRLSTNIPSPTSRFPTHLETMLNNRGYKEYTAFNKEFIKVTDEQVELREKYGLNMIARHYHIQEKMLRLKSDRVMATVLGGNYTYKVYRGNKKVGTLSIAVNYSGREGTEMYFTYKSRKKIR